MFRDKIDKILDSLPEEELENVYWSIVPIKENHMFKQNLYDKGVKITEIVDEAENIIDLWDSIFAQNISEQIKEQIYYEQYKWHIFSYEKQECLKEDVAKKEFDILSKDEFYVMYQGLPIIYLYTNANEVVSKDFDSQEDIYIFDKNLTWTYIHTHESMCGPYFYKIK